MSKKIYFSCLILLFVLSLGYSQTLPTDIPGLLVWYDANDNTLSPGPIGIWHDKSGNGFDLLQNNTNLQPELISNVINGKKVVRYSSAQVLRASFNGTYNNPGTIFLIYSTSSNAIQFVFDNYSNTPINGITVRDNNSIRFFAGSEQSIIEYDRTVPFDFLMTTILVDGSNSVLYENSDVKVTGSLSNNSFNGITVGQARNGARQFKGDIAEIIYFSRALTQQEIDEMHNYLGSKYGDTLDLGSDITQTGFCDTTIYAPQGFQSYLWSDGSTADSLVVTTPDVYWCEGVNDFGAVSRDSITVSFSPIQIPSSTKYCVGDDIIWNAGLGTTDFTYQWSTGATTEQITINSEDDYYVTVTDSDGCTLTTDTLHFMEDLYPSVVSLGSNVDLCSGNKIGLLSGAGETVSYSWSTGETTPEIIIQNSGTYHLDIINDNGCPASLFITVNIIGDAPLINFNSPTTACNNTLFPFQDNSSTTDGSTINSWSWDFGDSSTASAAQGNHYYTEPGEYIVTFQVGSSSGCFNDTTFLISVKNLPQLMLSSNLNCQNENIEFYGGQISSTPMADWKWDFDDLGSGNNTDSIQNTTHLFSTNGDFDVMLIGTDINGCSDTLVKTITVFSVPDIDFSYQEVCAGGVVNYQNNTTIDSLSQIIGYQWSFGDGTTSGQANPEKPYSAHGSYPVILTVVTDKGCSDSKTDTIKIHAIPQVDYFLIDACAGIDSWLIDNSYVSDGSVAQVEWSINGQPALIGSAVSTIFPLPGIYTLKQTVKSAFGCSNSSQNILEINDFIEAKLQFTPSAFVIDYPILFESIGSGANNFHWSFGDSIISFQQDTTIVFDESQIGDTITVWLVVENNHGCTDSTYIRLPILDQRTDLEVSQLFHQEINGFVTTGVQIKNKGTTPITEVELYLRRPKANVLKEVWKGELQAGESEIYISSSSSSSAIMANDSLQNYICVTGKLPETALFQETNLENNEACNSIVDNQAVIISPYPNPVRDELKIRIISPEESEFEIEFYNHLGQTIYSISEPMEKGLNILTIDTSFWTAGKYSLRYNGEFGKIIKEFIKL